MPHKITSWLRGLMLHCLILLRFFGSTIAWRITSPSPPPTPFTYSIFIQSVLIKPLVFMRNGWITQVQDTLVRWYDVSMLLVRLTPLFLFFFLNSSGWFEIARPQVHGYDMNCIAAIPGGTPHMFASGLFHSLPSLLWVSQVLMCCGCCFVYFDVCVIPSFVFIYCFWLKGAEEKVVRVFLAPAVISFHFCVVVSVPSSLTHWMLPFCAYGYLFFFPPSSLAFCSNTWEYCRCVCGVWLDFVDFMGQLSIVTNNFFFLQIRCQNRWD